MTTDAALPRPRSTAGPKTQVRGLPDPGERVPALAWPTALLYVATLALFALEVVLFASGVTLWITVPIGAAVTFLMFSVLHEATHHAVSTNTRVNDTFGRISAPFVAPYGAFSMLKFIHIEHHRNTNEPKDVDPDAWTSEGPWWQLPFRWATIDAWYLTFYVRRFGSRPRAEQIAAALTLTVFLAALVALGVTGHLGTAALLFFLPQRIGLAVLAWWFDYLPHHGLTVTQREDKYRATRVRVGAEPVLTPLFVYQNYHLVHHLHPSVPFYRYVRAWRRNEQAYLDRDAAITTWFGRSLTPEEYRTWRRLTDPIDTEGSTSGRMAFHPLRVSAVEPQGTEGVAVTFELPVDLHDAYAHRPGQHVTLRAKIDGDDVRRTYSTCDAPRPGHLRVGIRHQPGGIFSTWANTRLEVGDILDVMTPNGRFAEDVDDTIAANGIVAIGGGSGITPIKSVIESRLAAGADAHATLLYANRTPETAMFDEELRRLEVEHDGRFRRVDAFAEIEHGARLIDGEFIDEHCPNPDEVGAFLLCGPEALIEAARAHLRERGVGDDRIHTELFTSGAATPGTPVDAPQVTATVEVTLDGRTSTIEVDSGGGTLLEAALDAGIDAPYSCAGGACGTCRAKIVDGGFQMDQNHVLSDGDVAGGALLACQARPTTERAAVTFDD